jgi:hypothetical protein
VAEKSLKQTVNFASNGFTDIFITEFAIFLVFIFQDNKIRRERGKIVLPSSLKENNHVRDFS